MSEAYLMYAQNIFGRIIRASGIIGEQGDNYQVYIPENRMVIGYFFNQDFGLSDDKFCNTNLKEGKKKKLDYKISTGKFIKKFDVNTGLVEILFNSSKDLERAKVTFNINLETFSNVYKFRSHRFVKK